MPVRNERGFTEAGIRAVLERDYSGDLLDVIVADGASPDGTREILGGSGIRLTR